MRIKNDGAVRQRPEPDSPRGPRGEGHQDGGEGRHHHGRFADNT